MATIINASNSTGLTLTSDLSGVLQFQQNGVNLPMGGVAPAFSAGGAGVSASNTVKTKIPFTTKKFDTNTNFNTSTYAFTPTVAGYYQINAAMQYAGTTTSNLVQVILYKNGSQYTEGGLCAGIQYAIVTVSDVIYMNGSTDYIEVYGQQYSGSTQTLNGVIFSGCLVRGA